MMKVSKTTKSEKWFGKKQKDLTKDELLEFWRLDEMHKKFLKKDREIEKYKRVYVNTNNRLIEKDRQILELKQQLAKKDKEIKHRHWVIKSGVYIQDKISFAVEQLEKVKELIKNMSLGIGIEIYGTRIKPVEEEIDNQIKQLIHQHKDKGE